VYHNRLSCVKGREKFFSVPSDGGIPRGTRSTPEELASECEPVSEWGQNEGAPPGFQKRRQPVVGAPESPNRIKKLTYPVGVSFLITCAHVRTRAREAQVQFFVPQRPVYWSLRYSFLYSGLVLVRSTVFCISKYSFLYLGHCIIYVIPGTVFCTHRYSRLVLEVQKIVPGNAISHLHSCQHFWYNTLRSLLIRFK